MGTIPTLSQASTEIPADIPQAELVDPAIDRTGPSLIEERIGCVKTNGHVDTDLDGIEEIRRETNLFTSYPFG